MPTAKQLVALAHDTPDSCVNVAPGGFGLDTRVQLVPFHRSIKAVGKPAELVKSPTAKQLVVVAHDTLTRRAFGGPGGLGLAAIDHAGDALAGALNANRSIATNNASGAIGRLRVRTRACSLEAPCKHIASPPHDPVRHPQASVDPVRGSKDRFFLASGLRAVNA